MDHIMEQEIYPMIEAAMNSIQPLAEPTIDQIVQACQDMVTYINTQQGSLIYDDNEQRRIQGHAELSAKRRELIGAINHGMELLQKNDLINSRLRIWRENQKTELIGTSFLGKEAEFDAIYKEYNTSPDYASEFRKFATWMIEKLYEYPMDNRNAQQLVDNLKSVLFQLDSRGQELCHQYLLPVVFNQPEPVLKTKAKINPLELRILGAEKLGMKQQLNGVEFTVDIITEEAARQLTAGRMQPNNVTTVGKIINPVQRSTLNEKEQVTVKFSDCKLESVEHRTKSATKGSAIEQKYALLFRSKPLQGGFILWTLSLPLMVTVHGSQNCELFSAIFWLRAFGSVDYNDEHNQTTSSVTWPTLARAIIRLFAKSTEAIKPLSDAAVENLAEKMFGPAHINDLTRETTLVTFERFAKNSMNSGVAFSCWDYMYSIMQLVKQKEVLEFWNNEWLFGFISKQEATQRINSFDYPTFLLRFSDTQLGALSIVYVDEAVSADGTRGRRIDHLIPFTAHDLVQISLKQRIRGCDKLQNTQYLYPNIDKQRVIASMTETPCPLGYVRGIIVVVAGANSTVNEAPIMRGRKSSCPVDRNGSGNPMRRLSAEARTVADHSHLILMPHEPAGQRNFFERSTPFPIASPQWPNMTLEELDELLTSDGC